MVGRNTIYLHLSEAVLHSGLPGCHCARKDCEVSADPLLSGLVGVSEVRPSPIIKMIIYPSSPVSLNIIEHVMQVPIT